MATIKPTKKNSPAIKTGHAKNNKDADAYAKNGTGVAAEKKSVDSPIDPNKLKYDQFEQGKPTMSVSIGNKTKEPKSSGIQMRGAGAATKGRMSRGPMA